MSDIKKTVLTYGTFDLFHVGHLNLLNRLKALGDELIVAVSTDEFNSLKGKKTIIGFDDRAQIVSNLKCVDKVIPERNWEQKVDDIREHNVTVFGMGSDWEGCFDDLSAYCKVVYLPRTEGVSSTHIKQTLNILDSVHIDNLKKALDLISSIVERFD